MDNKDNTVRLYTSQTKYVTDLLEKNGVCYSRREYVKKKYGDISAIFTTAYDWFSAEAIKYMPKPPDAEYPYWAFKDLSSVERFCGSKVLQLKIPVDEAILFNMYDWNKILRMQFIGDSEDDEKKFRQMLKSYGIHR